MGCNVCRYNNQDFVEKEFKYAYNNHINENEKIEEENNNEDNKINEKNEDSNKDIIKNLNDNNKIEKEKDIISDEIPELKPEKKVLLKNNSISTTTKIEENKINNNNIQNNNLKNNNQNKEETKDDSNKNIIPIQNFQKKIDASQKMPKPKKIENLDLSKQNSEKENIDLKEKNNISVSSVISSLYKNDYNSRMIDLINKLRTNPREYSKIILSNIQYIQKIVKISADDTTGQNEEKIKIFFQKKIKVELYRGESAFLEAAEFLKNLKPLKELKIKEEIKMNLLPETEEQIANDKLLIKNQLNEINKRFNISAFFKDNLRNPEIGLMLMVIGDNKNSQNKKRNAILNRDYKYIAVNSKFIGDKFVSYFTFSK